MIHRSDQHCLCILMQLVHAQRDGNAHFTVRLRIHSEGDRPMIELRSHLIRAMTGDDDDLLYSSRAEVVDAGFNYGAFAEGKQWLEGAHAPGQSGGQNNRGNIFHILSRLEGPGPEVPKVRLGCRPGP